MREFSHTPKILSSSRSQVPPGNEKVRSSRSQVPPGNEKVRSSRSQVPPGNEKGAAASYYLSFPGSTWE